MSYTTAQIDSIIAQLQNALAAGATAAEFQFEGRVYRAQTAKEISARITYFTSLYDNASDASPNPTPKTRTFYLHGGNGIYY
jgi:predicted ATPase